MSQHDEGSIQKMVTHQRTHTCGALRLGDVNSHVVLTGWINRVRDHGGVFFLDLRDRFGITQVVTRPDEARSELIEVLKQMRPEDVIQIHGQVNPRPEGMINTDRPTGEIEVVVNEAAILSASETPPFQVDGATTAGEDLRLEYRYLDLRRPDLQSILRLRHKASMSVRRYLDELNFMEIETPILVKPTPEGARDFLVPSREHPGRFYALPQSPQLYKQMLMVSGMDRYFQLARCMRDEDLRADRQPEHTQIDMEMSFVSEDDIYAMVEEMIRRLFSEVLGFKVATPFERLDYDDCMDRFGSDKPDLRYQGEIIDVTDILEGSAFRLFTDVKSAGNRIKAMVIPGGAALSRKESDALEKEVQLGGAKGLARTKVGGCGIETGFAKHLEPERAGELIRVLGASEGDLLGLVVDERMKANRSLGRLRATLAAEESRQKQETSVTTVYKFLWVRHFPLFEKDEATGAFTAAHHMFTMPLEKDIPLLESDPLSVRAQLYDLVMNGVELGSGSIRIHRRDIQEQVMRIVGLSADEADKRFGFLLKAFQYGAPPHGGIALGLDRLIMLMAGCTSIRDTIAFPKTTSAMSLVDGAPAVASPTDLKDLHVQISSGKQDLNQSEGV